MDKWMILTGAGTVAVVAFIWLALAMQEQWHQVYGGTASPATRAALRALGASGLIISGVLCFVANRPSMRC